MPHLSFEAATTLAQLWESVYRQNTPEDTCLHVQDHDTPYALTYRELNAKIQCLNAYLLGKGLQKGDRVLILAGNNPNYAGFDFATTSAGGIVVTLSPAFTSAQLKQVLAQTTPRFVFLASYGLYRQHAAYLDELPDAELLCQTDRLDELRETDRVITLDSAIEQGKTFWRTQTDTIQARRAGLQPTDRATVFYDRHDPDLRGVVHTHGSLLAEIAALAPALSSLARTDKLLSVLSPSYPLQRVAGLYLPIALGIQPVHLQALRNVPKALSNLKPTFMLATPALLEALIRQWRKTLALSEQAFGKYWAAAIAYHRLRHTGGKAGIVQRMKYRRARRKLFKPLASKCLPGLKRIFCLGAGLSPAVEYFFLAAEVPVVTGFGLPETGCAIALSDLDAPKLGAQGVPLPGVTLNNLQNGGELTVTGPMLSPGYWPDEGLPLPYATGLRAKTHNGLLYLEEPRLERNAPVLASVTP